MLTDIVIRKAAPSVKAYKLGDSKGLYVWVSPTGAKSFRHKFRFDGKEKLLTYGLYPDVKLSEARLKVEATRALLRAGIDPTSQAATVVHDSPSFETVARDWHVRNRDRWSAHHGSDVIRSLEVAIFGPLGALPINQISIPQVLAALRSVEVTGAIETARRIRQRVDTVFSYAIASGLVTTNPAASVKGALQRLPASKPQPAILDLDLARKMLAEALAIPAQPVTRLALRLLALTAVRPGELRYAEWSEFDIDGDKPVWTIPASRMKGDLVRKSGKPHLVSLATAAIDCIKKLKPLTGAGPMVFPSIRQAHMPMSENAIGYLLNRAGYAGVQTAHGLRATFSTVMNERFPADRAVIDLMLAHVPDGESGSETAYNRAVHMGRRRELAEEWAKLLSLPAI